MSIETASLPHMEGNGETRRAIDDLMSAFEAFKQSNDERLNDIEKRNSADVLLEEKVDRLNERLGQLSHAVNRPPSPAAESAAALDVKEQKAAFESYMRGHPMADTTQTKSHNGSIDSITHDAIVLPPYLQTRLDSRIASGSAIAQLAQRRTLEHGGALTWVMPEGQTVANWVSESGARDATEFANLKTVTIGMNELYANPCASQRFIDDAQVDVEAWILDAMTEAFAAKENAAFIFGDGVSMPKGLMQIGNSYTGAESDKFHYVKTGGKGVIPPGKGIDILLEALTVLPARYRANAVWTMNANILAEIRKMKDDSGSYVWMPPMTAGQAAQLFGHPIYEDANMEDLTTGGRIVAFGDFAQAYMIIQRPQTQLIRDPYSEKPFVQFYTTRRIGGGVIDTSAVVMVHAVSS